MAKQADFIRYTIRVPREIYTAIEHQAAKNQRSVNAEVIQRLADTVSEDPPEGKKELKVFVEEETYAQIVENLFIYDFNLAEYVNDILQREIGRLNQYRSAYEELTEANGRIHELERQIEKLNSDGELLRELFTEYRNLLHQRTSLLKAICYRVLQFKSEIPPEVASIAQDFLNADGEGDGDYASELPEVAEARYHAIIRKKQSKSHPAPLEAASRRKKG